MGSLDSPVKLMNGWGRIGSHYNDHYFFQGITLCRQYQNVNRCDVLTTNNTKICPKCRKIRDKSLKAVKPIDEMIILYDAVGLDLMSSIGRLGQEITDIDEILLRSVARHEPTRLKKIEHLCFRAEKSSRLESKCIRLEADADQGFNDYVGISNGVKRALGIKKWPDFGKSVNFTETVCRVVTEAVAGNDHAYENRAKRLEAELIETQKKLDAALADLKDTRSAQADIVRGVNKTLRIQNRGLSNKMVPVEAKSIRSAKKVLLEARKLEVPKIPCDSYYDPKETIKVFNAVSMFPCLIGALEKVCELEIGQ